MAPVQPQTTAARRGQPHSVSAKGAANNPARLQTRSRWWMRLRLPSASRYRLGSGASGAITFSKPVTGRRQRSDSANATPASFTGSGATYAVTIAIVMAWRGAIGAGNLQPTQPEQCRAAPSRSPSLPGNSELALGCFCWYSLSRGRHCRPGNPGSRVLSDRGASHCVPHLNQLRDGCQGDLVGMRGTQVESDGTDEPSVHILGQTGVSQVAMQDVRFGVASDHADVGERAGTEDSVRISLSVVCPIIIFV